MTFADLVYGTIVPIVDNGIIPLLYALAFMFFLYGVGRFFISDSEENRKKGKDFAIWGFVGFFVLFSVWGIVKLLMTVIQ